MQNPLMIPASACKKTEQLLKESKREYKVRDFLSLTFEDYCTRHKVPQDKLKIVRTMIQCRTGKNGYTLTYCPNCQKYDMHAVSCGNRNCPSCGWLDTRKWIEERKAELIDGIRYYHVIFTLPHQLTDLIAVNEKLLLGNLFAASKDSILELSDEKYGMVPGILMVLHSFSSKLTRHYHIHMLVTGGGLSQDKTMFKECKNNGFFLPVEKIKGLYRKRFMDRLKALHEDGKLKLESMAERFHNRYEWSELMNACYEKKWNVEIREYGKDSQTGLEPEKAIEYFARYTNRAAITDSRIISYDKESITFEYKDYQGKEMKKKTMTLTADEFITRFLSHIMPKGFRKIRTAGFLSGSVRKKNMQLIHKLRGSEIPECRVSGMKKAELIRLFYGKDPTVCEKCGVKLEVYSRVDRKYLSCIMKAG